MGRLVLAKACMSEIGMESGKRMYSSHHVHALNAETTGFMVGGCWVLKVDGGKREVLEGQLGCGCVLE